MKFDELNDVAKERARSKWRESLYGYQWWDDIYDDAVVMGALLGIRISITYRRVGEAGRTEVPDIHFSGFSSQGDGCDYSGKLWVDKLKGAVVRITEEARDDNSLMGLAKQAEELYSKFVIARAKYRFLDEDVYTELEDIRLQITNTRNYFFTFIDDELEDYFAHLEPDCDTFVQTFAEWVYRQLENEYDHLTSDETIEENIRANELLFDETGLVI
jgi:hypothetical protein